MRDKVKQQERHRIYYKENRAKLLKDASENRQVYKKEALLIYGNGKIACVECGFSDIRALTIDHIDGGGSHHFKKIGYSKLYRWLKQQGYPSGYQTLCMNCQYLKREKNKEYGKTVKKENIECLK